MQRERLVTILILALVASTSWFVREAQHGCVELLGRSGWITTDPDSQYQMRRVERALDEGLPPAEFDERMNAPQGSAILWPPYYVAMLAVLLGPFAPEPGRDAWIEMAVGSSACVFSVLGSLLAALAARRLAGNPAALVAGLVHALCGAAVAYGKVGNGDHHAFVSLTVGAVLFVLTCAFDREALGSPKRGLALGAAAGALAGLAMGAWVASLIYVIEVQLALGILVLLHSRRPRPAVAPLGLSFHLAALLVLAPAVVSSAWRAQFPWMVVCLSWFHLAFLALGAGVFVPLLALHEGSRVLRSWPWIVAGVLAALGAWIALGDGGPARGVKEGLAWMNRADSFMARVAESRPLVGAGTSTALFDGLGFVVVALPIAWGAMVAGALRGDTRLWPWVTALPLLAAQAARQGRFAEALALPMAVALGFGAARLLRARLTAPLLRLPRTVLWAIVFVVVTAGSWPCVSKTIARVRSGRSAASLERPAMLGARLACEWLGKQPKRDPRESVMSLWTHGHLIERVAARASVATNFGPYVGLESFRASPRFLLSEDFDAADAILDRHRSRFVLVDSDLPNTLNTLLDAVEPELRTRYVPAGSEHGGNVLPAWFLTMGARMMFDGAVFGPLGEAARPLDRLRLVWISPLVDPSRSLRAPDDRAPAAWVWERVPGALVEARGDPGEALAISVAVTFAAAGREIRWSDRTPVGVDGIARLRVPYCTDAAIGEGRTRDGARWKLGGRGGVLDIPESAVQTGSTLSLP